MNADTLSCRVDADTEEFKEALVHTQIAFEQFERALSRLEAAQISVEVGPVVSPSDNGED